MPNEASLRDRLANGQPDLVVDLALYPTQEGGKAMPIRLGYGCPCCTNKDLVEGWDGYPLLDAEMRPGERRRVGFVFLSGQDAVKALRSAQSFYLWEGKFIGEAQILR